MEAEMEVMTAPAAPAAPVVAPIAPPLLFIGLGDLNIHVTLKDSRFLSTNYRLTASNG